MCSLYIVFPKGEELGFREWLDMPEWAIANANNSNNKAPAKKKATMTLQANLSVRVGGENP